MNKEYKQSYANKISGFLHLSKVFLFFVLLTSCTTAPKLKEAQFYKGKIQVYNKEKDKTDYVTVEMTVNPPQQLRIDSYVGFLGLPMGLLVINKEQGLFLSYLDGKAYRAHRGGDVLGKLLKTEIETDDVIKIFSRQSLGPSWSCVEANSGRQCLNGEVRVNFSPDSDEELKLTIETSKTQISFVYSTAKKGETNFDIKIPKKYKVIDL